MLPTSLEAATARMMASDSIAREEAVLGSDFVEHFGGTREHEVKLWNEAVTAWEGAFLLYLVIVCTILTTKFFHSRTLSGTGLSFQRVGSVASS
jgi:hypothetical protein